MQSVEPVSQSFPRKDIHLLSTASFLEDGQGFYKIFGSMNPKFRIIICQILLIIRLPIHMQCYTSVNITKERKFK